MGRRWKKHGKKKDGFMTTKDDFDLLEEHGYLFSHKNYWIDPVTKRVVNILDAIALIKGLTEGDLIGVAFVSGSAEQEFAADIFSGKPAFTRALIPIRTESGASGEQTVYAERNSAIYYITIGEWNSFKMLYNGTLQTEGNLSAEGVSQQGNDSGS